MRFAMRMGDSNVSVSVIVLTYQNFDGLGDTLGSIAAQSYPNLELLISDDGSDDFPQERLKEKLDRSGLCNRMMVHILRNKSNIGIVAHMNRAAEKARGAYIKYLSPGDGFRVPYALSRLVALAQESGSAIITSPSVLCRGSFDAELYQFPRGHAWRALCTEPPHILFDMLARSNNISAVGTLYDRTFFDNGGLDESYRYLDDWPTWLAYVRSGRRIACLDEAVTRYRIGDGVNSAYSNAFQSPVLREDMIRCYEKEIFPYRSLLSPFTQRVAEYHLRELCQETRFHLPLQDIPFALFFGLRGMLKAVAVEAMSRHG